MTKARLSSSAPASHSGRGTDRLRRPEHTLPFIEETSQRAGSSQNSKPNNTLNTKKEKHLETDGSIKVDLGIISTASEKPKLTLPNCAVLHLASRQILSLSELQSTIIYFVVPRKYINAALSKFADLRCEDDPELSMLRSIAGDSSRSWDATPSRLARLREHEYEDQSDNEQATETVWKGYQDYLNKPRTLSAGARHSHVRDMESRLAGFRHEKMKSSSSRESHDDRLDGLVYDSDFDCYYNPVTDQYYKLQPGS